MLVLTRRLGEEIVIAGNIHVHILAIQGTKVRIGVSAPRSTTIDRAEIHAQRVAWTHDLESSDDAAPLRESPANREAS